MSLLEELRTPAAENARAAKRVHPEGWEPGVAWDGRGGTITSRPLAEPTPDWTALLEAWGFDPVQFEVVEPVQVRTWDAAVGNGETRTMWYYKAGLRQRRLTAVDVGELVSAIKRHRGGTPKPNNGGTLIVCLSDWQMGKQGSEAAVARILAMIDGVAARIREVRPARLHVYGLGDIVEGCDGFYEMQSFTTELNVRDQVNVVRRLLVKALTTWAPLVSEVTVAAVGGNHGEERRGGKAFTDFADNRDVAVFEQVAEILSANSKAYGHVRFVLPREQLTLTLSVEGHVVGLAHGHQARKGVENWWKGQAFGMRPVGDATLLFTGHFHHLLVKEEGSRTLFQAPTMDSGSQWFEETVGKPSVTGTLTVLLTAEGWSRLEVVR